MAVCPSTRDLLFCGSQAHQILLARLGYFESDACGPAQEFQPIGDSLPAGVRIHVIAADELGCPFVYLIGIIDIHKFWSFSDITTLLVGGLKVIGSQLRRLRNRPRKRSLNLLEGCT